MACIRAGSTFGKSPPPPKPCGCAWALPPSERAMAAAATAINSCNFFIGFMVGYFVCRDDYDTSGCNLLGRFWRRPAVEPRTDEFLLLLLNLRELDLLLRRQFLFDARVAIGQ